MKFKSKFLIVLIIICVLFTIASVSANNITDDDSQLNTESNQNLEPVQVDDVNQDNSGNGEDYKSFNDFYQDIQSCNGTLNLEDDYRYAEGDDYLLIRMENLVINGNSHVIDGNNYEYGITFNAPGDDDENGSDNHTKIDITINDVIFKNFNESVFTIANGKLTLNNVTFINCYGSSSLIYVNIGDELVLNNCGVFCSEYNNELISAFYGKVTVSNSHFNGENCSSSFLVEDRGQLVIENCTFENFKADIGAVISFKGYYFSIRNSKFLNSHARFDGGAIIAKYYPLYDEDASEFLTSPDMLIENCLFYNLSSTKDGGVIYIDLNSGCEGILKNLNITNSNFTDCTSRFGGVIAIQGGNLNIVDSNFTNSSASFEGGVIYSTWSNVTVINSNLINNTAQKNAGAIYFDKGRLTIRQSNLTHNKAFKESESVANCIYAHDVDAYFADSTFDNGGISVYADFASDSRLVNVTENEDIFLLDNKNYIVSIESNGMKLNLVNKSVVVDDIPSKYDMRDYGWVSPVKKQGDNFDCWAFATVASLESSLLKKTGALYNLSQNYVQALQLKYARDGDLRISLTGFAYSGLGYALSWKGVLPMDDAYDDRGLILDTDLADSRIHVQDAMIIFGGMNDTDNLIKQAIMKYGAVTVQVLLVESSPVNWTGEAVADHEIHFVSIIGWDDGYTDENDTENTKIGAWIVKDSTSEFAHVFYEDELLLANDYNAVVPQNAGICYIFENDIDYHVNYQTDLTALTGFDGNYTYYSNKFTSKYDEWIGAVGTYFNESGIEYSFDVYVNGTKVHSQSGVSEFAGFRTIVLNRYIPIKTGDNFTVVFKNNALPYQAYSRQHYMPGMTFVSSDGENWSDFTLENKTVCLKVYTTREDRPYYTFEELNQSIAESDNELNLTYDYQGPGEIGIIKSSDFTLNGNGHIIDGDNSTVHFILDCRDHVIVLNNLTFQNFFNSSFDVLSPVIFNNVKFINCSSEDCVFSTGYNLLFNNCVFENCSAEYFFNNEYGNLIVNNTLFKNGNFHKGFISLKYSCLLIENSTFEDIASDMAPAINYKGYNLTIKRSKFVNLHSRLSAGAIMGKFFPESAWGKVIPYDPFLIEECEFINVSSINDGGAIFFDMDSGAEGEKQTLNIINTSFINCESRYGGAIADQGGILNIVNSTFKNNFASFEGGAIYTTWANLNLINVTLFNNTAEKNAGAIYFDKGKLTIKQSSLTGNKVLKESADVARAIYAYDVDAYFADSIFDNGGISVYADFASDSKFENVTKNDDIFLMDNKNYVVSVESNGIKLKLVHNEIIVEQLPPQYNSRDWGWVTPVKKQGDNDDCWAFATVASLETSLLKATGVAYNLSQNYVQALELKYARYGDLRISLTGFAYSGLGYALSWIGALPMVTPYDDRGTIADTDLADSRIHVQDAMIIFGGRNDTNELIKRAIMKYGAVTVQLISGNPIGLNTTGEDIAIMDHGTHFMSLIGWDDYSDFGIFHGVWKAKDSIDGYCDLPYDIGIIAGTDYYAIIPQSAAIAYIFENTIDYHVNYQTDLTGLAGFDGNYTYYSNEFTSKYDELIGAVGTYFNDSGIEYSFDVYVNGAKVHSQSGVSEFAGFRTIVLNKYIPIKTGDKFKVVFKNNALPFQAYSRMHYMPGMSMVSADGKSWSDITLVNRTVCLKVYTVKDDTKVIGNKDIAVDYDGGSYFTVKVVTADGRAVGAGAVVKFTINGKTTSVITDSNGIAKIKITQLPGKYAITTVYKGKSVKNTVTVKQVLKATKVTVKNTDKKLYLQATLKINGKAVSGKTITFKFNGKTYKAKTNKNGIAKVQIKQKIIKKLKCKTYPVQVTYLKDTIKTTVKVKQVLKASKTTVKKTDKKFKLKATLKINGKAAKGKTIKFKFNGKTYKAKTNKKGVAQKVLKKNIIKKLKRGKKYNLKVYYGKDFVKTTVNVKH